MSQPIDAACDTASAESPARPARASRRNSARYLPSTAATACSLVMARAATVAARSSMWTSAAVRGRCGENAPSSPWSDDPATILTNARVLAAEAGSRGPTGSLSTTSRPVRSKQPSARACSMSSSAPAIASTRPSVVVTTAAPEKKPATASQSSCQRAAGEHDAHEHAVHLVLALQQRGLALDDGREGLRARRRVRGQVVGPERGVGRRGQGQGAGCGGWQGLCGQGRIVGNIDHPVTVDPSIASLHASADDPAEGGAAGGHLDARRRARGRHPGALDGARRAPLRPLPRRGRAACSRSSPWMPCRSRPRSASPCPPVRWPGVSPPATR